MPVLKYRPDESSSWQTVGTTVDGYTKEETDTLLAGKAPAGYGLGTSAVPIDDYNNAVNNGWYRGGANYPSKINYANYGMIRVDSVGQIKFQTFYAGDTGGAMVSPLMAIRKSIDYGATWSEWEYVNPPMTPGEEYRTTERINGKAVYKKNVNGAIKYRLDGETDWKPYTDAIGSYSKTETDALLTNKATILTSNLNIYVSTTGSDTTGDGSSGNPFRTIQHAVDMIPPVLNGKQAKINLSPGTYDEDVYISGKAAGGGYRPIQINGGSNLTDAANYKVRSIYVAGTGMGSVNIKGINFTGHSNGTFDFYSYGDSCAYLDYCILDSITKYGIYAGDRPYSHICIVNSTISNKTNSAIAVEFGNVVQVRRCTGTDNAAVFKAGFDQGFGGVIFDCGSNSISGTVAEVKNYGGQIFK